MIGTLLAAATQATPCETVGEWWPRHRIIAGEHLDTIHQAIAGGFAADRVGWAFASGYQAALHALFPGAPEDRICALCVTEAEGNSPKAIKSALRKNGGSLIAETEAYWEAAALDPAAGRWERDRELLKVASSARELRTTRAWERLKSGMAS